MTDFKITAPAVEASDLELGGLIDFMIYACHERVDGRAVPERACFYYQCRLCGGTDRDREHLHVKPTIEGVAHTPSCLLGRNRHRLKETAAIRREAAALTKTRDAVIEECARWLAPNFPGQARDMVRALKSSPASPTEFEKELTAALRELSSAMNAAGPLMLSRPTVSASVGLSAAITTLRIVLAKATERGL